MWRVWWPAVRVESVSLDSSAADILELTIAWAGLSIVEDIFDGPGGGALLL